MAQMNTGTAGIWTTTNTNIMAMPPMMRQEKETVMGNYAAHHCTSVRGFDVQQR